MGRKRNQGKARKAAKAKAQEEEEERGRRAEDDRQRLEREMEEKLQQLPFISEAQVEFQKSPFSDLQCRHGAGPPSSNDISSQFAFEFLAKYNEACDRGARYVDEFLLGAKNATMDEFADVWNNSTKMEMAMSAFLGAGTHQYLEGNHSGAMGHASIARFFEQHIAVELKHTQAVFNWPKIFVTSNADEHSLVKFFRHRIPCSCLDEKYKEVKSITKLGFCYNIQCKLPDVMIDRSKTKYCSQCRCVTYCSRECQEADWSRHKPHCEEEAGIIAKFHWNGLE